MKIREVIDLIKNEINTQNLKDDEYIKDLLFYLYKDYKKKDKNLMILGIFELLEYLNMDTTENIDLYRYYIKLNEGEYDYENYRTISTIGR